MRLSQQLSEAVASGVTSYEVPAPGDVSFSGDDEKDQSVGSRSTRKTHLTITYDGERYAVPIPSIKRNIPQFYKGVRFGEKMLKSEPPPDKHFQGRLKQMRGMKKRLPLSRVQALIRGVYLHPAYRMADKLSGIAYAKGKIPKSITMNVGPGWGGYSRVSVKNERASEQLMRSEPFWYGVAQTGQTIRDATSEEDVERYIYARMHNLAQAYVDAVGTDEIDQAKNAFERKLRERTAVETVLGPLYRKEFYSY